MFAIVRSHWSPRALMKSSEAPGKPKARMTGGWIADLAALKKAILLCDLCVRKFDHKAYGYNKEAAVPGFPKAIANCDGCKRTSELCTLFLTRRPS